jgi:hypothetical protein
MQTDKVGEGTIFKLHDHSIEGRGSNRYVQKMKDNLLMSTKRISLQKNLKKVK